MMERIPNAIAILMGFGTVVLECRINDLRLSAIAIILNMDEELIGKL